MVSIMGDLGHELWFGCFVTPSAQAAGTIVQLVRFADQMELDLVGIQDHPYQPRFLDTWTLLSALARETARIRLVPDVLNLPLRPPAVLARAAASLDILSGGRLELGLGSGAFWDGVEAMGGERRSAGEAVEALEEAIAVIRALWTPGRAVSFEGKHYRLRGARPGPTPPHPIGIWLGAYKPRMLRLTGRLADGWLPSIRYADPPDLGEMTRTIDEAAVQAGRDPVAVRRAYNIGGQFLSSEQGFLQGPPRLWIEHLTELAMEQGMSVFLLGPGQDAESDLRRFADEVAPGVREAVAKAREAAITQGLQPQTAPETESAPHPPMTMRPAEAGTSRVPPATRTRSGPTPRAAALSEEQRPHLPHDAGTPVTPRGRQSQEALIQVHDHLRLDLRELREIVAQVAAGAMDAAAARSLLNRMAMRQNYWTLGAFCAQYCRVVSIHHTIEDYKMFPDLQREDKSLKPVLNKLREEHEIIAEQIDRVDRALVAMMNEPAGLDEVKRVSDELGDMLLSHLAYEEDELLTPLGRLEIAV
jgi:hypothetical protein